MEKIMLLEKYYGNMTKEKYFFNMKNMLLVGFCAGIGLGFCLGVTGQYLSSKYAQINSNSEIHEDVHVGSFSNTSNVGLEEFLQNEK